MSTRFRRLPRTYLFWVAIFSYLLFLFVNAALGVSVTVNVDGKVVKYRSNLLKIRGVLEEGGVSIEEVDEVRPDVDEYIDGRPIVVKKKEMFALQKNRIWIARGETNQYSPSVSNFAYAGKNTHSVSFKEHFQEYIKLKHSRKHVPLPALMKTSKPMALNVPLRKRSYSSRGSKSSQPRENADEMSRSQDNPKIKNSQSLVVIASAYAPGAGAGHITAIGKRARRGIVAVDPRVIPLGTKLYIPGYGYGVAADTGGAIKGNRIDLCFDTREEAINWGRRRVVVYIIR